ncbi:MAG: ankyrin repeat domain-containing protein [Gammaproteobacteria bacterium]|nr:ankyrin repeat domain-containing protein [Gammaproteobacteria bacterium]
MSEQNLNCILIFKDLNQAARSEEFLRAGNKKDPSLYSFYTDLTDFESVGNVQFVNFLSGSNFEPSDVLKILFGLNPKYVLADRYRDDGSHSQLAYSDGKKIAYKKLVKDISDSYPEIGLILAIEKYDARAVNRHINEGLNITTILPLTDCLVRDVHMYITSAPMVEALINAGAPLNVSRPLKVRDYGTTAGGGPMHIAAVEMGARKHKIIQLMLEKGADVNHQDAEGNTVLHEICSDRYIPIQNSTINKLFEAGADFECKNNNGMTPIMYLAWNSENTKKLSILKLFAKLGVNFDVYHPEHGSLIDLSNKATNEIRDKIEITKKGEHIFADSEEERQKIINFKVEELEQGLTALKKSEDFIASEINK